MAELPKLSNLLEPIKLNKEEDKMPKFKSLLNENKSQTPQQKSYADLMPGNTNYVKDEKDTVRAVDALKKFGSFMENMFAPDNKNESTIKTKYDDYNKNKDLDTVSGTSVDYKPINNEPMLELEDIQNLNKKVGKIASNVFNTVAGSGASTGGNVANSIDMLIDLSLGKDKETIFEKYGEGSQKFAQEKFKAGAWEDNNNIMESLKQGNIKEAVSKAVQGTLQNSAQLVTVIGMGLMSGGASAGATAGKALPAVSSYLSGLGATASYQAPLALITAAASGGKYASLDNRNDLSVYQKVTSGLLSGGLEAATEAWGSLKYLDDIANSVPGIDRTIRSEIMKYAKTLIDPKKLASHGITEAKEEYIAQFGNALFDSIMGISDKSLPEVIADQEPYLNSAAVGLTSGIGMSGVGQVAQFNKISQNNKDITNSQKKADQFINYVEEGSNFNLSDETKQKLWVEAVNVNNPSKMYDWFQKTEKAVKNNDLLNFDEASEFLDSWYTNKEVSGDLISKLEDKTKDKKQPKENTQTELITNPLDVSDTDLKINTDSKIAFADLTDQELLGLREGIIQETEFTNDPTPGELESIEAELDSRGLSYGEKTPTEVTELGQNQEEGTTKVEEPTKTEKPVQTEPEQSGDKLQLEGLNFDELNDLKNELHIKIEKAAKDSTVPDNVVEKIRKQIVEVDDKLAEVASQDDSSMIRQDNVRYSLEETFKESEANGENISAEELIGRANERLIEQGEDPISQQEIEENDIYGEWERTLELNGMLPEKTTEEVTEENATKEIESVLENQIEEWEVLESNFEELLSIVNENTEGNYSVEDIETAKENYIQRRLEQLPDQNDLVEDLYRTGVQFTNNINEALWLFPNGTMIDGEFDMGSRGLDHRIIESSVLDNTRDEPTAFWNEIHDKYKPIRLAPETNEGLIKENQEITDTQRRMLEEAGYETTEYLEDTSQGSTEQQNETTDEELLRVRRGLLRGFGSTEDVDMLVDLDGVEAMLDERGIEYESRESVLGEESEEVVKGSTINFNSAAREDLMNIDGIGSTTADRIIEFRNNNQFKAVEDLLKIKGIGQNTLLKLKGLNLDFQTVEADNSEDSTETIEEPTESDITSSEDADSEAKNLDVDDVIKDVEKEEGKTRQTDELLSEEARDLAEFEDTDIREYLDVVLRTSLEDLASVTEAERNNIIDEIAEDDPDVAEAIRAEIEERGYEPDDLYSKKYNKSIEAKQKEDIKNVLADKKTDGTFEGVEDATRRQIENIIRKDLGIPLRYGKLQSRNSEGQYDSVYKVIRTRDYSNMEVTAHEVGHHLSSILDLDIDAFPELVQLLKDEGLSKYYPQKLWSEEGNSEFFKYYFNSPGEAKLKAPNYFDYVESVIQGNDMYDNIKLLQNKMATWNIQSPEARVSGSMSRKDLDIRNVLSLKDKITEVLVDKDIVMKKSLERAGYDVNNLPTYKNPWKLKRLYSSVNDIVDKFLTKTAVDSQGRPVGKPLLEILNPVTDYIGKTETREFGDFEVYSLAMHALEREAKFLARDLEQNGNKKGKIAASRINMIIEDANTEALINSLQSVQNNPMQLKNLGLELETKEYQFKASGININDIADTVTNLDSKLFRNTLKELQEYQNHLIHYAEYYGMLSKKSAKDIRTSYNFHMPMQRYFGEELVDEGRDTIRYVDLPEVVKSAYGSTRIIKDPIRSLVKDTSYIIRQSNKNNITVKFMEALDAKKEAGIGYMLGREITVQEPINNENVVSYRVNGEIKSRVVHPDIYRALQGMNEEESHILRTLLKPLEYSNSLFKKFAVINPKFWLNNLGRDEVRQMIYEDTNGIEKLKLFSTMVDGMSSAFGLESSQTKDIFEALGGARGGFAQYLNDMDSPETLKELLKADKISKNPFTWLGDVAQWTEDTRRLGLFKQKIGMDTDIMSMSEKEAEKVLKEAAYFAKGEILEDYSIKGRWTKEIDRYVAPFSAAGVTGARHLYNKLKKPSSWINGLLYVTMPALVLWARNKDKPEYQELPAWKKMLYFNFVKDNGEIISFPKPFITGYFFGAIPEMLADYAYNQNGQELTENLKTVIQAGAPNYQMAGGIAAGYEVITNNADPLGDNYPIIPDSEKYLDAEDQYGNYNSELAKMLGKTINVSPRIIDHLMEGQFTGTYSMVTNIIDWTVGAKDYKESILGIVGVYSDPFITSTTVNNLYEERKKYNAKMANLREKFKLKQNVDMSQEEIIEAATKYSQLNDIADVMAKRRNISDIIESLDIDQDLKDNAKKYLSIENINLARNYYNRGLIYLDGLMTPKEVERINSLIDWIENNY